MTAYAETTSKELLSLLHVSTKLDKAALQAVGQGKSVVLTGNPGDGKTHLLRVLTDEIRKLSPKAVIELDASEKTNAEIVGAWQQSTKNGVPYCIAINEAVLLEIAETYVTFEPVVQAQAQVEQGLYCSPRDSCVAPSVKSNIVVFDLSRRNVLTKDVVESFLKKFCSAKLPKECIGIFEIEDHAKLMMDGLFHSRLQIILDRLSRRGFHCTLRDLQGFIGYLLGKGLTPAELAATSGNAEDFLTELIYAGEGALFMQIRKGFDPAHVCHPTWDTRLVANEIEPTSWSTEKAELYHSVDTENVAEVERRRRIFFFFNRSGDALLNINNDVDFHFEKLLEAKSDRDVLLNLVSKINRAFCYKHGSEELRVWKSHRYDHGCERMLYSTFSIKRINLEVLYPKLSKTMASAFEYVPDHIVIQAKNEPSTQLIIDFQMYEFLYGTEFGDSVIGKSGHLPRRLWRFMERLAVIAPADSAEVDAKILDVETGELVEVVIDAEDARYLSIQSTI